MAMGRKPAVSVVITDLDNTLWNWFAIWHSAFRSFLDALVEKTGLREGELKRQIKVVHERHQTSEYTFLLQELPAVYGLCSQADIPTVFADVIGAHKKARKKATRLYPGVRTTLEYLHDRGCLLVGYTESMAFYTSRRLIDTGLDRLLEFVYSPPDHDFPVGINAEQLRSEAETSYMMRRTVHRATPNGVVKPAPELLKKIISELRCDRSEVVYIGDDQVKDVEMAQAAHVRDVHAEYGKFHDDPRYPLLVEVSHWPREAVEKQRDARVKASYTLKDGFEELRALFDFNKYEEAGNWER